MQIIQMQYATGATNKIEILLLTGSVGKESSAQKPGV